jgi:hypothetical protein
VDSFGGDGFAVYSVKARLLDMGVRSVCTPLYKPFDVELSGVDGRDPFATAMSKESSQLSWRGNLCLLESQMLCFDGAESLERLSKIPADVRRPMMKCHFTPSITHRSPLQHHNMTLDDQMMAFSVVKPQDVFCCSLQHPVYYHRRCFCVSSNSQMKIDLASHVKPHACTEFHTRHHQNSNGNNIEMSSFHSSFG